MPQVIITEITTEQNILVFSVALFWMLFTFMNKREKKWPNLALAEVSPQITDVDNKCVLAVISYLHRVITIQSISTEPIH